MDLEEGWVLVIFFKGLNILGVNVLGGMIMLSE